jgi:hypothetical protein
MRLVRPLLRSLDDLPFVAILVGGVCLRVGSLAIQAGMPLEPDGKVYLRLASEMDVSEPWAASLREPLWVLLVKAWCSVFGYGALPLRILTTLLSIAGLLVGIAFFRAHLRRRSALICSGLVAAHGLLVLGAGRGLREDLVGLLVLCCAWTALAARRLPRSRAAWGAAALVGLLAGVRLEVGLLMLGLLVLAVVARQVPLRSALLGLLAVALVVVPWLQANAEVYGDPFASSNDAASFWYRADTLGPAGVDATGSGGGPPAAAMSWQRYYVEVLGPGTSVRRVAVGLPALLHDSLATAAWPLKDRWLEERVEDGRVLRAGRGLDAAADALAWLLLALACVGLARRAAWNRLVLVSAAVAVAGAVPYAALRGLPYFEERFISFLVPFSVLLAVVGADALRHGSRAVQEESPSPPLPKEPVP